MQQAGTLFYQSLHRLSRAEKYFLELCEGGAAEDVLKLVTDNARTRFDRVRRGDEHGFMGIHLAALHGNVGVLQLLLHLGHDVGEPTFGFFTCLHLACLAGHRAVVELLVEDYGADVNACCVDLDACFLTGTPFHLAAMKGHEDVVEFLLETGLVELDALTYNDFTPLHLAVIGGFDAIVGRLLAAGADVANDCVCDGTYIGSTLHLAALHGRAAIVRILLEAGADASSRADDGGTPLDWADDEEVVRAFADAGITRDDEDAAFAEWDVAAVRPETSATVGRQTVVVGRQTIAPGDDGAKPVRRARRPTIAVAPGQARPGASGDDIVPVRRARRPTVNVAPGHGRSAVVDAPPSPQLAAIAEGDEDEADEADEADARPQLPRSGQRLATRGASVKIGQVVIAPSRPQLVDVLVDLVASMRDPLPTDERLVLADVRLVVRPSATGKVGILARQASVGMWRKRLVAVDYLTTEEMRGAQVDDDFVAAMQRLVALDAHENVLPVLCVQRLASSVAVVTGLTPGRTLADIMLPDADGASPPPLPLARALALARGLAAGLRHLHDTCKVGHGRVMPETVLLADGERRAVLTDFGLGSFLGGVDVCDRGHIRHLYYRAPEAMHPSHEATEASDVYSFGVLLFELASGRAAFSDTNPVHFVMRIHAEDERPSLDGLDWPQALLMLVRACWHRIAERRPSLAEIESQLETLAG